ncbi:uncharacterized protein M437DRAFT_62816 [Aureobasidium melanogenum CBS 110374]|uniref:Uncharacterized protein n=1 Tax=Aureobasidium melanogenum (strain CBS 110374) TaxID=1043003 RepID=A0A074W1J3_AURM1|nr:uncharacterized protein M437DRAFT_62816 [Aureobasidium melanogenum CBS 110374]KEQ66628.1 hypothetical protein M437DRAFT_62816 [Aureobasidium melanogenum CBS 110374]
MANTPFITGHLAHDLLHTLADLDKGDKLLGISSLLGTSVSTTETTVKHPKGLVAVILLQWLVVYLVRHLILRTAGTLMVETKTRYHHDRDSSRLFNHTNLGYLRHALASPRRLRRDIILGFTYNTLFLLLSNLVSSFSSSASWEILSQIIVGLLLANLHLRWTCTILSAKKPLRTGTISLPRRELILPTMVDVLAQQVTARLPVYISKTISGLALDRLEGIAVADAIILITAFGLRLLVLYPAFAARVYKEIRQLDTKRTTDSVSANRERTSGFGAKVYGETVRFCFRKTALGFVLLHLQMVLVLVVFELVMSPVLYRVVF